MVWTTWHVSYYVYTLPDMLLAFAVTLCQLTAISDWYVSEGDIPSSDDQYMRLHTVNQQIFGTEKFQQIAIFWIPALLAVIYFWRGCLRTCNTG